jgi:hypothetical protein
VQPLARFEPMNDDEKSHMRYIYYTRLRFWLVSFVGLFCLVFGLCYNGDTSPRLDNNGNEIKVKKWDYLTAGQMRLVSFCFLGLPIAVVAFVSYKKRLLPYSKDARRGEKELISYPIIRKQYFEHTGQYFVSFDNPDYMHHEVDAAFYHYCSPGDFAYMYRAPLSKYVFDKSGRFSLL